MILTFVGKCEPGCGWIVGGGCCYGLTPTASLLVLPCCRDGSAEDGSPPPRGRGAAEVPREGFLSEISSEVKFPVARWGRVVL